MSAEHEIFHEEIAASNYVEASVKARPILWEALRDKGSLSFELRLLQAFQAGALYQRSCTTPSTPKVKE